jgi:phosphoserine aminotransferase
MSKEITNMEPKDLTKPIAKTKSPYFSSGPVKKSAHWCGDFIKRALLSRSHRSIDGIQRINTLIERLKCVLNVPSEFQIALVSGSATAAVETVLWNFITDHRPVDVIDADVFSRMWRHDLEIELNHKNVTVYETGFDEKLNTKYDPEHDFVFCLNNSTAGNYFKNLDWIDEIHQGLVICDATSGAFAIPLDYKKIDIVCLGLQKGMAAEASFGVIILSKHAVDLLNNTPAQRPIPRLLNLRRASEKLYGGFVINTPSLLLVEEALTALDAIELEFGTENPIHNMHEKALANKMALDNALKLYPNFECVGYKEEQSPVTAVIKIVSPEFLKLSDGDQRTFLRKIANHMSLENVAYDIVNHIHMPPSIRFWIGPTIDSRDIEIAIQWLDYFFQLEHKNI